ncbi:MAG: metallophosphoesterase [Chloroflexi bacterium]|nr:metallophosphoesterase [Chloroflexota bacterium]
MRIAIMSDSHDNIWKLAKAIPHLEAADAVLHCGDLIAPFMIIRLIKGTGGKPVHVVWGNNDGDKRLLAEVAASAENIHLHGEFAEIELGGLKVAINHYPKIARALAESGRYDLVCYGHDHTAHEEWIGETLLLNPGEMMGLNGRSTIALYNTKSKQVAFVEL